MNEPKRRGRPPKNAELAEAAREIRSDFGDGTLLLASQAYAKRVWDGQGTTIPRVERLRRVAKALEGQGLSMEGVSL